LRYDLHWTDLFLFKQAYAILEQETSELIDRLRDEEGTPEICFTEQAIEFLEQRKSFLASKVCSIIFRLKQIIVNVL